MHETLFGEKIGYLKILSEYDFYSNDYVLFTYLN
ncbi:hypothetical protein SAMN05421789_10583 [Kaistella chaponensis]|uniref:Uncharacterized protein n=1 Tax=Kaistella chaponensis TaxID=713588 RepID=A0A1N7LG31_9FLAO|nr:hypothetical protein SAMN05421789_10583 [Kaistella chaponensis]